MERCERCGALFDRSEAVEEFDEEYGFGSYEYSFQWNDFCLECAKELEEEDDEDEDGDEPPSGCSACGGPWPNCKSSCPIYDD